MTPCWVCGAETMRGLARERWMGANYQNQTMAAAPLSPVVCEACIFIMSRISPVPGRPAQEGKKFGANFRNVSHLYDASAPVPYLNASKGEKPAILRFLRAPHGGLWFAAIADSGQKHVLPWTPLNPPGARGRVRFEEATVTLPDARGWGVVDDLAALLTAGATKEEIERGEYTPRAWSLCGDRVRAFERTWGEALRGGDWFALALWLSQRDEVAVAARMAAEKDAKEAKKKDATTQRQRARGAGAPDGEGDGRRADRVPARRREPAQAVGHGGGASEERQPPDGERRGVGDRAVPWAPARSAEQLGLFGDR